MIWRSGRIQKIATITRKSCYDNYEDDEEVFAIFSCLRSQYMSSQSKQHQMLMKTSDRKTEELFDTLTMTDDEKGAD